MSWRPFMTMMLGGGRRGVVYESVYMFARKLLPLFVVISTIPGGGGVGFTVSPQVRVPE